MLFRSYNLEILYDLENKLKNPNIENLETLNEEISVLKRVIDDNKRELENIVQKLSELKDNEN